MEEAPVDPRAESAEAEDLNRQRKFTADEAGVSVNSISSVCENMGLHVNQSIKENIWKGEYVELSQLLPKNTFSQDQQIIKVIKPREAQLKIDTIDTWTDAFMIYMSIFLVKHSEAAQDISHFMMSVRQEVLINLDWKKIL